MSSDEFARFAATLRLVKVPEAVVRRARWALLDTVGVAIAGAHSIAGRVAILFAREQPGSSLVLGTAVVSSAERAAFAGGVCASSLDLDDGHYRGGGIHPGAPVIASLVAAASPSTTVGTLLTATLVGYETAIRAGARLAGTPPCSVTHTSGTAGTLGATAAIGRLRDRDPDTIACALAIADAHAPRAPLTTNMAKEAIGWAAATAVAADELVAHGFGRPRSGFPSTPPPPGFDSTVLDRPEPLSPLPLGPDGVWEICNTYVKSHGCCRAIHAALDALDDVLARRGFTSIAEIERIDVWVGEAMAGLGTVDPPTLEAAQFSFPHVLATRLVRAGTGPVELDDASLSDPAIRSLARRIVLQHDAVLDAPAAGNYPATLSMRVSDGTTTTATVLHARGSMTVPLSQDELCEKFVRNAEATLGSERAEEVTTILLDPSADDTPVIGILRPRTASRSTFAPVAEQYQWSVPTRGCAPDTRLGFPQMASGHAISDRSATREREWVAAAVRTIKADANRSVDTHLIRLELPAVSDVHLYLKDESTHPTGSLKHRLARSLFLYALCNGWLLEGMPVIEASSGSTAVSEAYFARLIGCEFVAVMPAATSPKKVALIERYGGRCHLVEDPTTVYSEALRLQRELGGHYIDQFTHAERATDWRGNNNIAESIFTQMALEPHPVPEWIITGAGTGGTSATIGRYIRYGGYATRLCVPDPEGSAFFDAWSNSDPTHTCGGSLIEGIGRPRVEPSFVGQVIDRMIRVPDACSVATMRAVEPVLGRRVGPSTGTNLWSAFGLVAEMVRAGRAGSVVALLCDGGDRYANTYYNDGWVTAKGWQLDEHLPRVTAFLTDGVW